LVGPGLFQRAADFLEDEDEDSPSEGAQVPPVPEVNGTASSSTDGAANKRSVA